MTTGAQPGVAAGLPQPSADATPAVQLTTQDTPTSPSLPLVVPAPTETNIWDLVIGPEATHWSRLLLRDHLDSHARLALFQVCRGSRDLVLHTAEHASIHVKAVDKATSQAWLPTVKQALQTRGTLCSKLQLSAYTTGDLSYVLGVLERCTTAVDDLGLHCYDYRHHAYGSDQTLASSILPGIGPGFPHLRVLTINAQIQSLPSPVLFPNLKQLQVIQWGPQSNAQQAIDGIFHTVRPYIRQLTHLSLPKLYCTPTVPPRLLNQGSMGTHLHTLHLHVLLDDKVLGRILRFAPVVQELGVDAISLESDRHLHAPTQWQRLQFSSLYLSSLARLPLAPGIELILVPSNLEIELHCDIDSIPGPLAARLNEVRVCIQAHSYDSLRLQGEFTVDMVDDEPAALRECLALLCSWHVVSQCPTIVLHGWTMSVALMLELPNLPPWQRVEWDDPEVTDWELDPDQYSPLLRLLPGSFVHVSIAVMGLPDEMLESICLGAPLNRTAEAPLRIRLSGCEEGVLEAIQQRMQLGAFRNVVVEGDDW